MPNLQETLISKLSELPDVHVARWKDSDLLCVYVKTKEIAHFQNEHEIDIRLSPAIIKREGLQAPKGSLSHPDRAKQSRWVVQSFSNQKDISKILRLISLAIQLA